MNKLSKEKRDKLILFCLIFVGVAGILYTFVLGSQKDQLNALHKQLITVNDKLSKADRLVRSAPMIDLSLKENQKALEARQEGDSIVLDFWRNGPDYPTTWEAVQPGTTELTLSIRVDGRRVDLGTVRIVVTE